MENRTKVTLDFTKCSQYNELYAEMRTKMEWQDFYGENLDALWDILTGLPYKGDSFTILRQRKYYDSENNYNGEFTEYVDKICGVFEDAEIQGYNNLAVNIIYSE